ncbi:MAG: hypothetical protein M5U28_56385 [Sandaracinaceae bacterium]|nr:hypothetical protein [Sandaracinaceae bacterium]
MGHDDLRADVPVHCRRDLHRQDVGVEAAGADGVVHDGDGVPERGETTADSGCLHGGGELAHLLGVEQLLDLGHVRLRHVDGL